MFTLTVYENNDRRQPKTFRATTRENCLSKLGAWLDKREPDVCLEFTDSSEDADPVYCLNYCESTRDWEWRESISDPDVIDSGTFGEMKDQLLNMAKLEVETC